MEEVYILGRIGDLKDISRTTQYLEGGYTTMRMDLGNKESIGMVYLMESVFSTQQNK